MRRNADVILAFGRMSSQCGVMTADDISARIARAVQHAPECPKQDLVSKDSVARIRAEDTLAAIIAAALKE
ncbi:hypothetical protein ASE00_00620 [Sphingomonas sp. Root710]|uniref:hypothetical protein n=1 Tax=Sphingomonas sp. Root710 TaxID=1736594 RepID=UPI0006FF7000|nr:hypothetical protein [Sphingomonas sp. Root710]KRB85345.1 hypothetical protein ASE00_00620 [Sphingomonas sp. Root710]